MGSSGHSHIVPAAVTVSRALIIGIIMNVGYALVELLAGLWLGSMGLVADAGHNFSDVAGLLLALLAVKLVQRPANSRYTFGYRKASVLISLLNALILLGAVAGIVVESIRKFNDPEPVAGTLVALTAAVGVAVNFISARLLMRDKEHDLNVRGAYLHMMLDALVSVGVIVSGVVISVTGWAVVDPIVGLCVAAVIVFSSWSLLRSSLKLSIDGVPDGVNVDSLATEMARIEGVTDVHHIHIWALSTTETAIMAHIVVDDLSRSDEVRRAERALLAEHGISHATLEIETCRSNMCDCC